jgi:hypothetical protein
MLNFTKRFSAVAATSTDEASGSGSESVSAATAGNFDQRVPAFLLGLDVDSEPDLENPNPDEKRLKDLDLEPDAEQRKMCGNT